MKPSALRTQAQGFAAHLRADVEGFSPNDPVTHPAYWLQNLAKLLESLSDALASQATS